MTLSRAVMGTVAVLLAFLVFSRDQRRDDAAIATRLVAIESRLRDERPSEVRVEHVTTLPDPAANAALERIEKRLGDLGNAQASTSAGTPAVDAPRTSPPTESQLAAAARARALVDHAVVLGTWTDDSKRELFHTLAGADWPTREEVMRSLVRAVNEGKIAVETPL